MQGQTLSEYNEYDPDFLHTLEADFQAQQDSLSPYACRDAKGVRREEEPFHPARPNFTKDTERILNCRYFNRYADKTQTFSLYRNDDITRRIQHVQIVSRIARTIGRLLKLNQDLIEAIALGHDLGHTPFGHLGERILSALLQDSLGIPFVHTVQSVRILDRMLGFNLSIQTLDGILSHNGRPVRGEYAPLDPQDASADDIIHAFDEKYALAEAGAAPGTRVPSTLEGCVVRLTDTISYIRKDRQDAALLGVKTPESFQPDSLLGSTNSAFIFNMVGNVVANSYGKPYLKLDDEFADALAREKQLNYELIYARQNDPEPYGAVSAMFERVYGKCVSDLRQMDVNSPIYRHHVRKSVGGIPPDEEKILEYLNDPPERIAADYIASMTDDYFMDLHEYLFPGTATLKYESYFR